MQKDNRGFLRAGALVLVVVAVALFFGSSSVEARTERAPRERPAQELNDRVFKRVCAQLSRILDSAQLPSFCKPAEPPPPVDVCPNLDGVQVTVPAGYELDDGMCVVIPPPPPPPPPPTENTAEFCSDIIDNDSDGLIDLVDPDCEDFVPPSSEAPVIAFSREPNAIVVGQSSTLSWDVTNATSCTASGGWTGARVVSGEEPVTPLVTTDYTLSCAGDGGDDTETVTITVTPVEPPPTLTHVVINEIAWMGYQGDINNEWIELHNPTDSALDITGWTLSATDGTPSIALSGSIPAQGYFLLERTDDTSVPTVTADQIYGGALGNTGETLILRDAASVAIDTVVGGTDWANIGGDAGTGETPQRTVSDAWIVGTPTPKTATP